MIWRVSDLAYFTATALALVMREGPIVGIINGDKGDSDGEIESENREQIERQEKRVA